MRQSCWEACHCAAYGLMGFASDELRLARTPMFGTHSWNSRSCLSRESRLYRTPPKKINCTFNRLASWVLISVFCVPLDCQYEGNTILRRFRSRLVSEICCMSSVSSLMFVNFLLFSIKRKDGATLFPSHLKAHTLYWFFDVIVGFSTS